MLSHFRVGSCTKRPRGSYEDPPPIIVSLADIVAHYIRTHRPRALAEMQFYAGHPSWEALLDTVGAARDMHGRHHRHQCCLPRAALATAQRALTSVNLRSAASFAGLISAVECAIGGISGIGPLMVYDTSLRLGAFIGSEPEVIYLHSGTRLGAKALGLNHRQPTLAMTDLPRELQSLRPREVEDLLCIYKEHLPNARRSM